MHSLFISFGFLAFILGGIAVGFWFRKKMPDEHVNPEGRDTVKLAVGLVATLSALVLGLLVASAKSSFDAVGDGITQQAARAIYLDRLLATYGPETAGIRSQMRQVITGTVSMIWPKFGPGARVLSGLESARGTEKLENSIRELAPVTDDQREIKKQALDVCQELSRERWLIFLQAQSTLPVPLLIGLLFWLTALHCGFGLLAPRNTTVIAALCVSAIAVSGTVFLILELDHPLTGLIRVSSAPFEQALTVIGK